MQAERRHRLAGLLAGGGDCDAQVLDDPGAEGRSSNYGGLGKWAATLK